MPIDIDPQAKRMRKRNRITTYLWNIGMQIRNETGGTLARNTLLAITGWDAVKDVPKVSKADADDSTLMAGLIVRSPISNNRYGYAFYSSLSYRDIDTSAAAAVGSTVFLSAVAGGFVFVAPIAPAKTQIVGRVTVKHATTGRIAFDLVTNSKPSV